MKRLAKTSEHVDLRFNRDELVLVNNALNELCHGMRIEDWEFQTRLGAERSEAKRLLDQINQALD